MIDDAWTRDAAKALRLGGPHCAHLLTTRDQAIARSFGTVQSVEVLDPDPARRLLAELAPITAQPSDDGPELVDRLLAAVGYLPLAIQLMGGYLNGENGGEPVAFAQQARTVLARLADPATRPGSVTDTLNATIALSLDGAAQADPAARATFHALGAFAPKPARFDLAAAQAVTQAEPATLARLIQRNLLEKGPDESLALHQTLAAFARTGTPDEAVVRHREHYLALVNQDREDWQAIEAIYEQIQWAWRTLIDGKPSSDDVVSIIHAIKKHQSIRGLWGDEIEWVEKGLEVARTNDSLKDQATFLSDLGFIYSALGEKAQALRYYEEALPLRRQVGDKSGEATTLNNMAAIQFHRGDFAQAAGAFEQIIQITQQIGDVSAESAYRLNLAVVLSQLDRTEEAIGHVEQSIALLTRYNLPQDGAGVTLKQHQAFHAQLQARRRGE